MRVHLPKKVSDKPPPLVVMFDGQNVFDDEPSFAGGWHLHTTARKIVTKRRLEPAIVAIDHGGDQRIHELSPWPSARAKGHLNYLLDWIVDFVMPKLAMEIGLLPKLEERIIGGSSMGGLAALYAHFRHPDIFGGAMSMSPSLWIAGQHIFELIASIDVHPASRIYLDAGAHEGSGSVLKNAERMVELLRRRGYGEDLLRFRKDAKGHHSERDWRRRAPAALRFLLSPRARFGRKRYAAN